MTGAKKAAQDPNSTMRSSVVERNTAETRIFLHLTIEGQGQYKVSTGIRFFDHMLEGSRWARLLIGHSATNEASFAPGIS